MDPMQARESSYPPDRWLQAWDELSSLSPKVTKDRQYNRLDVKGLAIDMDNTEVVGQGKAQKRTAKEEHDNTSGCNIYRVDIAQKNGLG